MSCTISGCSCGYGRYKCPRAVARIVKSNPHVGLLTLASKDDADGWQKHVPGRSTIGSRVDFSAGKLKVFKNLCRRLATDSQPGASLSPYNAGDSSASSSSTVVASPSSSDRRLVTIEETLVIPDPPPGYELHSKSVDDRPTAKPRDLPTNELPTIKPIMDAILSVAARTFEAEPSKQSETLLRFLEETLIMMHDQLKADNESPWDFWNYAANKNIMEGCIRSMMDMSDDHTNSLLKTYANGERGKIGYYN
ncbi:hypothetical protein CC1G_09867 [Coprinopsis cinerea okayama7|uniref:Uncharacterized protein n=1 Tax=Coprinopsis cinerea (strain Okayama-7 / 130 / ATCC MYA-4618 / FGSC 9003) TaxID=240176 RepID=A8N8K8_COPC7|nr:hypothetical protein CC1G_09867 [Coprinopsis cinerea okayama7\|eukprot:XP_001831164.1 hypothetical protein CC1G_09867 [Coprinopsis cinerea okayama7\